MIRRRLVRALLHAAPGVFAFGGQLAGIERGNVVEKLPAIDQFAANAPVTELGLEQALAVRLGGEHFLLGNALVGLVHRHGGPTRLAKLGFEGDLGVVVVLRDLLLGGCEFVLELPAFLLVSLLGLTARLFGTVQGVGLGAGVLVLDAQLLGGVMLLGRLAASAHFLGDRMFTLSADRDRFSECLQCTALPFAPGLRHERGFSHDVRRAFVRRNRNRVRFAWLL